MFSFITFPGFPETSDFGGTDLVTTKLAPIKNPIPIVTQVPIVTLLPIMALLCITTAIPLYPKTQFFPIFVNGFIKLLFSK